MCDGPQVLGRGGKIVADELLALVNIEQLETQLIAARTVGFDTADHEIVLPQRAPVPEIHFSHGRWPGQHLCLVQRLEIAAALQICSNDLPDIFRRRCGRITHPFERHHRNRQRAFHTFGDLDHQLRLHLVLSSNSRLIRIPDSFFICLA